MVTTKARIWQPVPRKQRCHTYLQRSNYEEPGASPGQPEETEAAFARQRKKIRE